MKNLSLSFSNPQIETEYLHVRDETLSQDYYILSTFLFFYILSAGIVEIIHNDTAGLIISFSSCTALILIGLLFRVNAKMKRYASFLALLVVYVVSFSRFFVFTDTFKKLSGGRLYYRGVNFTSMEILLIIRFFDFKHKVIGIIMAFGLKIGIVGWLDNSLFVADAMFRNIAIDAFLIYTFYYIDKRERQVFHSFYQYREGLNKFRELISDYLPQSIAVLSAETSKTFFTNKNFLDVFEDYKKNLPGSKTPDEILSRSQSFSEVSRACIDSLELDMSTLREFESNKPPLAQEKKSFSLTGLIKKFSKDNSSSEKAWTICAAQNFKNIHKVFEVILKKIRWDDEDAISIIFNDITYQEHIIALKVADSNKDKVLATVSHELRTPLNAIIGILGICEEQIKENTEVLEYLSLCRDNAHLLLSLVNSLLDLQQLLHGKFKINPAKTETRKALRDIAKLFKFQTVQKGIDLNLYIAERIPKFINTDEGRLKQILINLIANALKFTFTGSITIQVTESGDNREYLQISVIDTGVGIKDEDKHKLFTMYGKLGDKEGVNKNGVGLGLTIANALSLALSGRISEDGEKGIEVESQFGEGSTFCFRILKDVSQPEPELDIKDVRIDLAGVKDDDSGCLLDTEEVNFRDQHVKMKMENRNRPRKSLSSKFEEGMSPTNRNNVSPTLEELLPSSSRQQYYQGSRAPMRRNNSRKKSLRFENLKLTSDSMIDPIYEERDKNRCEDDYVIIVDDNPFNLLIADKLIKDLGYLTKTAKGSHEAVELMKVCFENEEKVKVVLMDCQMPVMDGFETTKIMKELMNKGEIQQVPIIALTANTNQRDIERCFECGMVGYLAKPLQKARLLSVLGNERFDKVD